MKYRIIIVVVLVMVVIVGLFGHTYQSLWKQVEEAQEKDLPKTAIEHLKQIEEKAAKELAYGQLLKSTLMRRPRSGMMMSLISEDTIAPNAPPMITPTAMSTTLPFRANALNSDKNFCMFEPPYGFLRNIL